MNPHWDEVDGVPTITLDEGDIQGPLHACLLFGVGRRDETLLNAGITHAVEHLAFQTLDVVPQSANGSVGPTTTRFNMFGDPEEVAAFFGQIAQGLRELPVGRLPDELRILQVEAAKRSRGQLEFDLSTRFGTKGVTRQTGSSRVVTIAGGRAGSTAKGRADPRGPQVPRPAAHLWGATDRPGAPYGGG